MQWDRVLQLIRDGHGVDSVWEGGTLGGSTVLHMWANRGPREGELPLRDFELLFAGSASEGTQPGDIRATGTSEAVER